METNQHGHLKREEKILATLWTPQRGFKKFRGPFGRLGADVKRSWAISPMIVVLSSLHEDFYAHVFGLSFLPSITVFGLIGPNEKHVFRLTTLTHIRYELYMSSVRVDAHHSV